VNLAETGPSRREAQRAGLLLHGRERLPEEMLDIADRLKIDDFRWVAPAADGGTWYPHRFIDPFDVNEPHIAQAIAACDAAFTEMRDGGRLGPGKLAIAGFSQGACIASEYVLRHPGCCAVLVMFTGGIIGHDIRRWLVSGVLLPWAGFIAYFVLNGTAIDFLRLTLLDGLRWKTETIFHIALNR